MLRYGPIARADLARRLRLSSASLSRLTKPLLARGLLTEGAPALFARTGRPSVPLDVAADAAYFIGCKIIADEIFSVVTDLRGSVVARRTAPLPESDPDRTVIAVTKLAKGWTRRFPRLAGIGIGLGGVVDHDQQVRVAPMLDWAQVDLAAQVSAAVGLRCVVENDVKAFTQAEHWFGAGRGADPFAVITVGAGVGCGLVIHDRLLSGSGGTAGAVGHQLLKADGPRCELGHRGCARALLTTAAVAARISEQRQTPTSFAEGVRLARSGDPAAVEVIREAGYYLGVLAGTVANVVSPERILLSGEAVEYALLTRQSVLNGLEDTRHWTAGSPELIIEPFEFFEWARGAAAVAIKAHVLGRQ